MRCPVCGYDNLIGAEVCDNCGADLAGYDVPQDTTTFHGRLMGEAEADCVLVTHDGRLVGIFTDRDAVVKAAGRRLSTFHVGDFMTPDPVVLRHDDPIAVAIHKMAVGGFRHIPIVEDGRPTGVVTARDVFHHLAETLG
jgi:CBS domain-containing protein